MRKYFLPVMAIASSIIISCQQSPPVSPPELTAVVDQLMAIQSSTKIGVNQIDYAKSITTLDTAIEKYKASDYAKKNTSLTLDLQDISIDHQNTLLAWESCTSAYQSFQEGYCWEKQMPAFQMIFIKYPDIQEDTSIREKFGSNEGYFYKRDAIVSKMWSKTSDKLTAIKQKLKS